jgi:rare lipoprotein A (peptidoglycan hydrolase)
MSQQAVGAEMFRVSAGRARTVTVAAITSALALGAAAAVAGTPHYKVGSPYQINGKWYYPKVEPNYDRTGIASWYGGSFHKGPTANGETFDMHSLSAAHPTLPLPSYAYVTNLSNGRTLLVRINNRGPYVGDRILDLSVRAAKLLGFYDNGIARVRIRYAGRAPLNGNDARERQHLYAQSWYKGPGAGSVTQVAKAVAPDGPVPGPARKPVSVAKAEPEIKRAPLEPPALLAAALAVAAPASGAALVAQLEKEALAEVKAVWREAMEREQRKPWRNRS